MTSNHTSDLSFKILSKSDINLLVSSFQKCDLYKPKSTFETYLEEQTRGERKIWMASKGQYIAGYITLQWDSKYRSFHEKGIPEIMDLNVFPPFRGEGIGSKLMDIVEKEAQAKSSTLGIGVGLYVDYGPAQRMYIKRGHTPDVRGVTYDYGPVKPGKKVPLDG